VRVWPGKVEHAVIGSPPISVWQFPVGRACRRPPRIAARSSGVARQVEVRCSTRRAARTTDCHEQWHAVSVARLMLVSNIEAGHARGAGKGQHAPAILRSRGWGR